MTQEELKQKLYTPLPSEAITKHPTKTYLSSIKGIYITERLNDVFGIGKWETSVECVERTDGGVVVVKVKLTVPELGISYESFGGNDNGGENSKNFDLGDAYKGATTDAISKIASYMGIGIDVFKGKGANPTTPTVAPTSTKTVVPQPVATQPKPTETKPKVTKPTGVIQPNENFDKPKDDSKVMALQAIKALDQASFLKYLIGTEKLKYVSADAFVEGEPIEKIREVYSRYTAK